MIKKIIEKKVSLDDIPDANKGGNCYQVAFDTLFSKPGAKLVHGVVLGQGPLEGIEFTHAWVEDGDTVIDNTQPVGRNEFPKVVYYLIGHIDITREYTRAKAIENATRTGHYGPWDKVFDNYL